MITFRSEPVYDTVNPFQKNVWGCPEWLSYFDALHRQYGITNAQEIWLRKWLDDDNDPNWNPLEKTFPCVRNDEFIGEMARRGIKLKGARYRDGVSFSTHRVLGGNPTPQTAIERAGELIDKGEQIVTSTGKVLVNLGDGVKNTSTVIKYGLPIATVAVAYLFLKRYRVI